MGARCCLLSCCCVNDIVLYGGSVYSQFSEETVERISVGGDISRTITIAKQGQLDTDFSPSSTHPPRDISTLSIPPTPTTSVCSRC